MLRLSRNTKFGRVIVCGLVASALAPAASPAYSETGSGSEPAASFGSSPDVVLRQSENAAAMPSAAKSGPSPDVVLRHSGNPLAIPDATPIADPTSVAEPGGFDWSSAGIGAAATGGLIVLAIAGLLGMRSGRRAFARS